MYLNSKTEELLGLGKQASVAFSFDKGIFIANANQDSIPDDYAIKVTKGEPRKVSDKRTYEYISKVLGLDNSIENHFKLTASPASSPVKGLRGWGAVPSHAL